MTNSQPTTNANRHAPVIGVEQIALLEKLCNASGVSGDEREVRTIVLEQLRSAGGQAQAQPLADEIKVDPLGSVYAIRHARKGDNPLRVMVDAHMDEVGFLIVSDEDGGLYRFTRVGGIDERVLPGKMLLVGKDHIPGVIGAKAIHLTEPGEMDNKIPLDALRIDIGPGGGKVKAGDWATYATRFKAVGPSFIAKALDNRLGCASLIELLRAVNASAALDHLELLFAWSVQEEIGARGARVAAYALDPELAFALDATPANDLPAHDGSENMIYNTRLGFGPAIYIADSSTLGDPRLAQHLIRTGDELGIPYQIRQPGGGGTDAGSIHRVRAGIPSISISVPGRYLHTAASVVRQADWEHSLALVWNALARLDRSVFSGERG
ncbi:MAG: M42 family peptidase [Chloroflexi bacterium]|nr:MAG: M42 family peptidase [Chloroflexota bacterium]